VVNYTRLIRLVIR